jgi:hypothetical protein
MGDWMQVVYNRRPRVLLRKQRMFVLDALKVHLTLEIRPVTHLMNTNLVVIPRGITS